MKTRTFKLHKLVRDNIVQLHIEMGGELKYKIISGEDLTQALLTKIIEEAKEMRDSDLSVGELADLRELVDALRHQLGEKEDDLTKRQTEKRKINGGFEKGHYVDTVTLPVDNKWAKYYAADPKRFPEIK